MMNQTLHDEQRADFDRLVQAIFFRHTPPFLPPSALYQPFNSTLIAKNSLGNEAMKFRVSSGFGEATANVSAPSKMLFVVFATRFIFCSFIQTELNTKKSKVKTRILLR